ncbi:MAG TPA: hypothetical protein ENK12_05015 [Gammaproteobacteria bacterium]|nr:hypothetical protein [Gammaproteobacteria bacterium]
MSRRLLWLAVLLLAVPLFLVSPPYGSHRLLLALWNDGHLVLFFLLALLAWDSRPLARLRWPGRLAAVAVLMLALGAGIELVQGLTGRDAQLRDVAADMAGAAIGLALLAALRGPGRAARAAAGFGLLLLVVVLWPLARTALDSLAAWRSFPVLSDFETRWETDRWRAHRAGLRLDAACARRGRAGLHIRYLPGRYPTVTLKDFPADWRAWQALSFSLYNPGDTPLQMELKVYDLAHHGGRGGWADRFNRELRVVPGWTDWRIPLAEIRTAPASREMDMSQIDSLSLFIHSPRTAVQLCLDEVRLE